MKYNEILFIVLLWKYSRYIHWINGMTRVHINYSSLHKGFVRNRYIDKEKYEREGRKEEHAGNNTMFPVSFSKDRILVPFITTDPLLFSLPLISGLNKLPSYKYLDFQLPRPLSLSLLSLSLAQEQREAGSRISFVLSLSFILSHSTLSSSL